MNDSGWLKLHDLIDWCHRQWWWWLLELNELVFATIGIVAFFRWLYSFVK